MVRWQDTNLALFGSSEDRQVKKETAEGEPAWRGLLDIDNDALRVWRIKNFKLEEVKDSEIGVFYRGDSFITLCVRKVGGALEYDIHFWIGRESTQDEYGTAAYKTVELDTFLDDKAVQHREVDGCESDKFLSYFPKYKVLEGGYPSGFKRVEDAPDTLRLFRFKLVDRKHVEIIEVPLSRHSLKSEDVFVIDQGKTVYQWNGKTCNKEEKIEAAKYLQDLESERCGRCATSVCEEGDSDAAEIVTKYLPDVVVPEKPKQAIGKKSIHRVSDASGEMKTVLISEDSLPRNLITEDDVYLINTGKRLFVYIGNGCSHREKQNALAIAHNNLKDSLNPLAPITVVSGNRKSKIFEDVFE